MELAASRAVRMSKPGYRRQVTRTYRFKGGAVTFRQIGSGGGEWQTDDGYAAIVYEGDYGGWTLTTPESETLCEFSLKGCARTILLRRLAKQAATAAAEETK